MAFFTLLNSNNVFAQGTLKNFTKLSCPEKCWVLRHPFIAKKAYKISIESAKKATELKSDSTLDDDTNGGQLDAFRHSYWMARTTQEFGWRRARSLGKAHEKGNYRDYKKHRLEDESLPDKQACEMDYLNNDVGIQIGKDNLSSSEEELTLKIKNLILSGKLFVLKKDNQGNFLKCNGEIIPKEELKWKWESQKCIVPSN